MNILILQGPNLNLLGLKSSENGKHITLDKLNKAIRKHVHGKDVTLKFLQTHKQFQAINFLQRNRKWADGLLCIPTSWAKYDWSIAETLNLINIPTAIIYFDGPFSGVYYLPNLSMNLKTLSCLLYQILTQKTPLK